MTYDTGTVHPKDIAILGPRLRSCQRMDVEKVICSMLSCFHAVIKTESWILTLHCIFVSKQTSETRHGSKSYVQIQYWSPEAFEAKHDNAKHYWFNQTHKKQPSWSSFQKHRSNCLKSKIHGVYRNKTFSQDTVSHKRPHFHHVNASQLTCPNARILPSAIR